MPLPALAMMGIQAVLSAGQGYLGNRAAKRQQQRMDEEAAQNKLISSFSKSAQPQQMAAQAGPTAGQRALADPLTKQLLAGLIGKIGGGAPPAMPSQAPPPGAYNTNIGSFKPQFLGQ